MLSLCLCLLLVALCLSALDSLTTITDKYQGLLSFSISSSSEATKTDSWLIKPNSPSTTSRLEFVFESMTIYNLEVRIYDSIYFGTGKYIFTCISCENYIPPPFYSTTGEVYVTAEGVLGNNFQATSFTLRYRAITTGSAVAAMNMSSVQLNMGYGKIYPRLTDGVVYKKTQQSWMISEGSKPITLSFDSFSFGTSCVAYLRIYDALTTSGNILFEGCVNSHKPGYWITSTTGSALVLLTNPSSTTDATLDFKISFYADVELYNCGSLLSPDVITDNSFIISDGSAAANTMRRGKSCLWTISPSSAGTVTLFVHWVSIKAGGTVKVYDGDSVSGTVLWDCEGPTYTTPPPLQSSGGNLYISYVTNTQLSTNYYGFFGTYQTNYLGSSGVGNKYSLLSMSSAVDLIPPGTSSYYTSGLNYTWKVRPNNIYGKITFAFSSLSLHGSDKITIYNGADTTSTVIGTFSGSTLPTQWYSSTNGTATVVFESKASSSASYKEGGFRLSYFADGPNYHCGFSNNPAVITSPSLTITDGSRSDEQIYTDQYCYWEISPVNATLITIFFKRFSIFNGKVNVYSGTYASGTLIASLSDSNVVPSPVTIAASTVTILFNSSSTASGYGFSLTYYGTATTYVGPGDGKIPIYSSTIASLSAMNSLSTPATKKYKLPKMTNITWTVTPANSTGSLYIFLSYVKLTGPGDRLYIHDGPSSSQRLLASYGLQTAVPKPYKWLNSTANSATIRFVTDGDNSNLADFDMTIYSDGANNHCGFLSNPTTMRSPSMVFTDGSSSTADMYSGQYCEWLIKPEPASAGTYNTIVLEFLENDLLGGTLHVYDGSEADGDHLLWSCSGCRVVPRPIMSHDKEILITFSTDSDLSSYGSGFKAVYWTVDNSTNQNYWYGSRFSYLRRVLELPNSYKMSSRLVNTSVAWMMESTTSSTGVLSFYPRYSETSLGSIDSYVTDGRVYTTGFESISSSAQLCGVVNSASPAYLSDDSLSQQASQFYDKYVKSSSVSKGLYKLAGSTDTSQALTASTPFRAAPTCGYLFDSGSSDAIDFTLTTKNTFASSGGRMYIFTGLTGYDHKFVDTSAPPGQGTGYRWDGGKSLSSLPSSFTAPCGKALLLVVLNSTSVSKVNYDFEITYKTRELDMGTTCSEYTLSLLPLPVVPDPWIVYYIGFGASFGSILFCFLFYYFLKWLKECRLKYNGVKLFKWAEPKMTYKVVTPHHPKYTPRTDRFRNRFLKKGTCCVCKDEEVKVFRVSCHHGLCFDCLKGYLEAALGNIALFPVKCPMHYEGCPGVIESKVSKRVLSRTHYERYLEFTDRAMYGEGMRCIFCYNYVNYPAEGAVANVECPYCYQRFCIRCKKPWHYRGGRCPLDNIDDSLADYKKVSGAQTCPVCQKLIEKSDAGTCNHMVHKITDGIPCIRDRSDFCYLCGTEVTQDYPHEEVNNSGVNHFPDGVFQNCRIVHIREREAERQEILRRRRHKGKMQKSLNVNFITDNMKDDPFNDLNPNDFLSDDDSDAEQPDLFDQHWNRALLGINGSNLNLAPISASIPVDEMNNSSGVNSSSGRSRAASGGSSSLNGSNAQSSSGSGGGSPPNPGQGGSPPPASSTSGGSQRGSPAGASLVPLRSSPLGSPKRSPSSRASARKVHASS